MKGLIVTYRGAYAGLPTATWLLALVALVNRCGTMVLPFLALYLTEVLGYGATEAGAFLGVYGVGAVAGSYLGGWLCDRLDPVRVQVLSLVAAGGGLFVLGEVETAAAIGATLFALSVVGEAFLPANTTHVAATCPAAARTRAMALNRLAINLGMTVGPAVGGFLAVRSYRWLFWIDGATCLAAALVLAVLAGTARRTVAEEDDGDEARSPWRDGVFLAVAALTLVTSVMFFQMGSTLPLYYHRTYGLREDEIGLLFAVNTLLIVALEMILIDRVKSRRPLAVAGLGSLFTGLGLALMPFGVSFVYAAFTVVVWTMGEMLSMPVLGGWVANRAGAESRGRYMGLYVSTFSAALIVAPFGGTYVYEHWGAETLWYGCGGLGVLTGLGYLILAGHDRGKGRA